jgi:hypothetical protein
MQNHKFVKSEDHTGRCLAISDDGVTICFEESDQHRLPILAEINPFLDIERTRLAANMRQDMEAASKFAAQYRDWSRDERCKPSVRPEHVRHSQVWEARAQVLSDALSGLERHCSR